MKEHDREIINILVRRDEVKTTVVLENEQSLEVHNITYNYDDGDDFAYITTNISPETGNSFDFFYTNEIVRIIDPEDGTVLFERS